MSDVDEYAEQAHILVDNVIENAFTKLNNMDENTLRTRENTKIILEEDYEIANIEWLTIDEFTVKRAEEKIHEFLKTWAYQGSWQYCIDYLGDHEHQYDVRYRFRVRWSIPTRRKPIPRATACVYFSFEVSKIKPKDYPVDIYYVFETNRLVHKPGQSRFREKWLKDIIESKVLMMEQIDF